MAINTAQKLQNELKSLQGLSIINIVCSALAMAFGVYFLMPNLISAATTQTLTLNQLGLIILGGLAFVVAIRWLISSAEIIDTQSNLNLNFKDHQKNNTLDDEALTSLIVKMTAAYREKKPTLKLMVTISRIAGVLFALSAVLALINVVAGAISGATLWITLAMTANMAINLGIAVACFVIPHFFAKYSEVWDQRLQGTEQAEAELEKALGEA